MRVLVAVASRHGSTTEIAERIAAGLHAGGLEIDIQRIGVDHDADLTRYDAFVVGSAVYEGHWLRSGRRFLTDNQDQLRRAPVFLFSSGPIGDNNTIGVENAHVAELAELTGAVDHRQFPGRLDRSRLKRRERWIVDIVRAHDGDFRDWDAVDEWAATIVDRLTETGDPDASGFGTDRK
jgi:menaquinone-dependent protoporphyrinogen oxidase